MKPTAPLRLITREEIAALPIRRYEGEVCVVATPGQLERALHDLRQERVLGLDTETRPAFRKGESYLPCLVQLATARAVWLFQLRAMDFSGALREVLEAPQIVKAGLSLAHDLRQLKLVFAFEPSAVVDVGPLAKRAGIGQTGVRNLAGMLLGFRIPKGNKTSNWAAPRLSDAQIAYAATDAWACRELYLFFEKNSIKPAPPAPGPGPSR